MKLVLSSALGQVNGKALSQHFSDVVCGAVPRKKDKTSQYVSVLNSSRHPYGKLQTAATRHGWGLI